MKVLIVDDWPDNIVLLKEYLNMLGFEFDVAENGQQALDKISVNNFHAVFMDIEMPVMNGIEATYEIRHTLAPPKNATPIIAISAHNSNYLSNFKSSGFSDFMSKPYTLPKLNNVLKKHNLL